MSATENAMNEKRITDEDILAKVAERGDGIAARDIMAVYTDLRTERYGSADWMRFARGSDIPINRLTRTRLARLVCRLRHPADWRARLATSS